MKFYFYCVLRCTALAAERNHRRQDRRHGRGKMVIEMRKEDKLEEEEVGGVEEERGEMRKGTEKGNGR